MAETEEQPRGGSQVRTARLGLFVLIVGVTLVTVLGAMSPSHSAGPQAAGPGRIPGVTSFSPNPLSVGGLTTTISDSLQLGISDNPHTICAFGADSCPAGVGLSRVTLSAAAGSSGVLAWPNVEIAFVIETTAYDGVYDPTASDPGLDPCAGAAAGSGIVCEESNGVPFFVANAQLIANSISAANPHSQVSFAMVDYFANINNWDDGDGAEYHVDIPQFIPSSQFGQAVKSTFQATVLNGNWSTATRTCLTTSSPRRRSPRCTGRSWDRAWTGRTTPTT